MSFSKQHSDICPQPALDTIRMQFEEEHDIGLAKKYAYSCRGRSLNVETMDAGYKAMIPAAKKGRRTAERRNHAEVSHPHSEARRSRKLPEAGFGDKAWKKIAGKKICGGRTRAGQPGLSLRTKLEFFEAQPDHIIWILRQDRVHGASKAIHQD